MSQKHSKIKIIFLGTPEFAVPFLQKLATDERFQVQGVITQQDRPTGRRQILTPPPIKKAALELGLTIWQPNNINKDQQLIQTLQTTSPDFLVVIAYGQILSEKILQIPRTTAINIHGSILPRYRGASPIESAILNGDSQTGLSIMQMVKSMDAGPVYQNLEIPISPDETAPILRTKLSQLGAEHLPNILAQIQTGSLRAEPQDENQATYCHKITREQGLIDPEAATAQQIYNKWRAYIGWPGIYLSYQGKNIKLLNIKIASELTLPPGQFLVQNRQLYLGTNLGTLEIIQLQMEGKTPQDTSTFLSGNRDFLTI